MTPVQITLDESTGATAMARAVQDGFGTVDDYVQYLIRADERRRQAAALLDSINSGEAVEMTAAD